MTTNRIKSPHHFNKLINAISNCYPPLQKPLLLSENVTCSAVLAGDQKQQEVDATEHSPLVVHRA